MVKKFSAALVAIAFAVTGPSGRLTQALAQTTVATQAGGATSISGAVGLVGQADVTALPGSVNLRLDLSPQFAAGAVAIAPVVAGAFNAQAASLAGIARMGPTVDLAAALHVARRGGVANSAVSTQEPTIVSRFRRFAVAVRALGAGREVRALRDPVQVNGQAAALDILYDRKLDAGGDQDVAPDGMNSVTAALSESKDTRKTPLAMLSPAAPRRSDGAQWELRNTNRHGDVLVDFRDKETVGSAEVIMRRMAPDFMVTREALINVWAYGYFGGVVGAAKGALALMKLPEVKTVGLTHPALVLVREALGQAISYEAWPPSHKSPSDMLIRFGPGVTAEGARRIITDAMGSYFPTNSRMKIAYLKTSQDARGRVSARVRETGEVRAILARKLAGYAEVEAVIAAPGIIAHLRGVGAPGQILAGLQFTDGNPFMRWMDPSKLWVGFNVGTGWKTAARELRRLLGPSAKFSLEGAQMVKDLDPYDPLYAKVELAGVAETVEAAGTLLKSEIIAFVEADSENKFLIRSRVGFPVIGPSVSLLEDPGAEHGHGHGWLNRILYRLGIGRHAGCAVVRFRPGVSLPDMAPIASMGWTEYVGGAWQVHLDVGDRSLVHASAFPGVESVFATRETLDRLRRDGWLPKAAPADLNAAWEARARERARALRALIR